MSNAPKSSLPKLIVAAVVAESINASPKTVYKMAKSGRCRPQHRILMGPVSVVPHFNFNLIAFEITTLTSLIMLLRNPHDKRAGKLLVVSVVTFFSLILVHVVLEALCKLIAMRYDQYALCFGRSFGFPAFYIGRMFETHWWFHCISAWVYDASPASFLVLTMYYCLTQPLDKAGRFVRTVGISLLICPLLYLLVPVSGPAYVFGSFPYHAPLLATPHVIQVSAQELAPPNGVPSMHMVVALLVLYFARYWKIGLVLGLLFVAFTASATLGLGEHYLIDLIAAVPYAALMICLCGNKEPNASCSLQA